MAKIFRKSVPKDKFESNDPFRIFQLDPPPSLRLEIGRKGYGAYAFIFALGLALVGATFQLYQNLGTKKENTPFVFVEVRAVDPEGHPVTGAKVRLGKTEMGFTDSFGEWRRFLRLELGSTLLVAVNKQGHGNQLFAAKNLTVPTSMPAQGDLEVKAFIQLSPRNAKPKPALNTPAVPPVAVQSAIEKTSEAPVAAPSYERGIALSLTSSAAQDPEAGLLQQKIFPVVQDLLRAEGMTIADDSELQLSFAYIPLPGATQGLIQGRLVWHENGRRLESSFLRNFGRTVNETARSLVSTLKTQVGPSYRVRQEQGQWLVENPDAALRFWQPEAQHILLNAGLRGFSLSPTAGAQGRYKILTGDVSPCAGSETTTTCLVRRATVRDLSPVPGWQAVRLRNSGQVATGLRIYASGYEARRRSPEEWEIWAEPQVPVNITAVEQGRVVYRQRLIPSLGVPTMIALPRARVAVR